MPALVFPSIVRRSMSSNLILRDLVDLHRLILMLIQHMTLPNTALRLFP